MSTVRIPVAAAVLALALLGGASRAAAQLMPNLGGQRAGISAMQFLKLGAGARAVAMGEAFVAVANDASALFWNPAGLAQFKANEVVASHTEYVVDVRHDFLGAVYHLSTEDVIGVSFLALHMEDMEITTETQPLGTGRYFSYGDVAVGLSYARRMTEQFSFGATVRYAEETMDILKMRAIMMDLGTYYWTGLGNSRFAVVIANFGSDVAPSGSVTVADGSTITTFQKYSLPTLFKLGFAIDPVDDGEHRLTTSIQLNHPNDNAENLRLGAEYGWQDMFFFRAGIKRTIGQPVFGEDATSEEDFALGAGVRVDLAGYRAGADYSYTNFNRLGSVHRITVGFTY